MKAINFIIFFILLIGFQTFGQSMQPSFVVPGRLYGQIESFSMLRYVSSQLDLKNENPFNDAQLIDSTVCYFNEQGYFLRKESFSKASNHWALKTSTSILYDENFKALKLIEVSYN